MSTKPKSDATDTVYRNFFGPLFKKGNFLQEASQQMELILRLLKDDRVPAMLKLLPVAGVAYALFPFDLIPDLFPVAGQLDDLSVLVICVKTFLELAPAGVVKEHLVEMANKDEVVDATWKASEDND